MTADLQSTIDVLYREHYSGLVAPLIRVLGGFALAEEIVQDVFATALQEWHQGEVPREPIAWLRRVAMNRALDRVRRQARWRERQATVQLMQEEKVGTVYEPDEVRDDMLRLVFTCCHPSLSKEAQVGLTLRTVCGLTTEQVARAFLLNTSALAQRLVRAQKKIESAGIAYEVPSGPGLSTRLDAVLKTVYLVFNEGYGASSGETLVRHGLCEEAIRLSRLLIDLLPEQSGTVGLCAMMLLHDSRRASRSDADGEFIPLDEQDRSLWNRRKIDEALPMVDRALQLRPVSTYAIEAAIAALHARARHSDDTDWPQIVALYELLDASTGGSPVVRLNRAVAVALAGHVQSGLAMLEVIAETGELQGYHFFHAARADLLRRLGRFDSAADAYREARRLARNKVERRFMERRLAALRP